MKCPTKAHTGPSTGNQVQDKCGKGQAPCGGNEFCDFNRGQSGKCESCDFTATNRLNPNAKHIHACSEVANGQGRKACTIRCNGDAQGQGNTHALEDVAPHAHTAAKCGSSFGHCSADTFCTFDHPDGSGECRPCHAVSSCGTVLGKGGVSCKHMCPDLAAGGGEGEGAALGGGYNAAAAEPAYAESAYAEPAKPAYAEPPAYTEQAYAEPAYAEPAYVAPAYAAAPAYVAQAHTTTQVEGCIDNYQALRGILGLLVICSAVNFIKGPNMYDFLLICLWMMFIEHLMCQRESFSHAANDYAKGYEGTYAGAGNY